MLIIRAGAIIPFRFLPLPLPLPSLCPSQHMLHARRPPSVYSQEDPLSFAIRPPDAETELERRARIQRETDAKRISDIIDEQLKIDRRNYDKSKQDVRVCLSLSPIPLSSWHSSPSTSSSCWARLNLESPPFKSNSNLCIVPTH
jgi:hypothetical protein